MKKSLLIIAAVALFAACSENDTVKDIDTQEVAIGFGSYINNTTKAELNNDWFANDDENSFGVYGFKIKDATPTYDQIFSNEQVTWNETASDWEHSTVRFWDKSKAYNFYAYAPYEANATFTTATQKFSFSNLELIQQIDALDNNSQPVVTDIAIAINQGVTYESTLQTNHVTTGASANGHHTGDVEFIFNHILSKLAFKIKSSTPQINAKIRVTEVKIAFPTISGSASWTQTDNNSPLGTTTIPALTAQTAITNNGVNDANFTIPVFTLGNNGVGTNWLSATAADIVEYTWQNDAPSAATDNKANEYIVVPVESGENDDVKGYEFAIKVVYDIQYMKLKNGATANSQDLSDYEEDILESGCIATGKIATADYHPDQNEFWTVTIDINPAKIEFCVDKINGWTPVDGGIVEVK